MALPAPDRKDYRIRPLKRGDRDAAFKLLASDGWVVPANDQELAISWVVQHPEMESFVAHDATAFSRLYGMITMSHRPQLKLGAGGAFDVVVVGAGASGLACAMRLKKRGRSVVVVDGGALAQTVVSMTKGKHIFAEPTNVKNASDLYVRRAPPVEKK